MYKRLILTDLKRIRKLFIPFTVISIALMIIAFIVMYNSDKLFKIAKSETVNIGIVMEISSTEATTIYNTVSNMESFSSHCSFIPISDKESGIDMLNKEAISALVIVPDDILYLVMNGTNPPVEVIYPTNGTIKTFIIDELFESSSSLLGTSQAAIYTVLSMSDNIGLDETKQEQISMEINALFLNNVLSRGDIFSRTKLSITGNNSIIKHYSAVMIFLVLSLCPLMFMSYYRAYNKSALYLLKSNGISRLKLVTSNIISVWLLLFYCYMILYITLSVASHVINKELVNITPRGILAGIILSLIIAIVSAIVSQIPISTGGVSLIMFGITLATAYFGGMLIPKALLPEIFKSICPYTPGYVILNYIISCL